MPADEQARAADSLVSGAFIGSRLGPLKMKEFGDAKSSTVRCKGMKTRTKMAHDLASLKATAPMT